MPSVKKDTKRKKIKNRLRVGIALGGGSARGIAHIGILKALKDHDIPIYCISGTSAGAIIAAMYAFDVPLDTLTMRVKKLSWYSISELPRSKLGLVSNVAIKKIVEEIIGPVDINKSHCPLAIVATDIETGEKIVFHNGSVALAVQASTCLPGLFTPVEIDGRKLMDGGLAENVPLEPLRKMGAEIVIGVDVAHWPSQKKVDNILDVISNTIDILINHQKIVRENFVDISIEPDLGMYNSSDFKKADEIVSAGYRAALRKIPEIRRLLKKKAPQRKPKGLFVRFLDWLSGE